MARKVAYLTVYQDVKQKIMNGTFAVGSLLPPEPELERIYGVSRTTVRKAVSMLVSEGFIRVTQGRGTEVLFSAPSPKYHKFHNVVSISEEYTEENPVFTVRGMSIDRVPATGEVAQNLQVDETVPVFRIQRISCMNEVPFSYMVDYLRCDIFPDLDKFEGRFTNLYSFLSSEYQVECSTGEEVITTLHADFSVSQFLDVPVGTSLYKTIRVAQCEKGPMEYAESLIRPDKLRFKVFMEGSLPVEYR